MKSEQRPSPPQQSNPSAKAGEEDASPASSLEEVRKRLQSFGYLNSRIERFYLASLSRSASLLFNRFLLSLRVGLLVGSLAAVLMTAGTLLFNVDLLRNKIDLALLFVYFELFFVLLFTGIELALIFLVSRWMRFADPRKLSITGYAISFLTGLAFFVYFFYWGRSQYEYLRLLSMPYLATMFIVLTLSCIFAAKCVWLGFLVAFRVIDAGGALPNWRRHGLEVMLALAAMVVVVPYVVRQSRITQEPQTPLAVLTTPDRWIVLGIDGLSQEMFAKFAAGGEIPFLSALASRSLTAQLEVSRPVVPPVSWSTIATGVTPAEHGILMPEARRWRGLSSWMQMTPLELAMHSLLADVGFGQRQPVSGHMRKVKAFWEILSDSGIACGVVNWWGSWPARPQRGWNISERYFYKRSAGAPPQEETYPPDLFAAYPPPRGSTPSGPALDTFYMDIFREQLLRSPVRVAALYLPGLDILSYEFYQRQALDPFDYTKQYRAHLRHLDEQIRSLSMDHPDVEILIVFHQGRSIKGDHSGILVYTPGGPKSIAEPAFAETDIIPLLLYTCGMPVSQSMGVSLIRAVHPSADLRIVTSFSKRQDVDSGRVNDFNDLLVEQMKSLGYLQ